MRGTYLYAIVQGEHRLDLGRLGLPDGWARVTALPGPGLTAVVSEYQGAALGELAKADLLRALAIHQRVVERAMADHGPVLPARFGTVLASSDAVQAALVRFEQRLATALEQLGDAVEIEVAATWDLKRVFAEIGRRPEIAALVVQAAGQPAGQSLATRVQVGKLVKEALDLRREACRQRVVGALLPIVRDAQPNALVADELVLNVAFLVERGRLADFDARIHALDGTFEGALTFRCVGPLPPYSFTTVEIVHPRPDEIEAARRLLELAEQTTAAAINASYRRLAARCHPDLNPGDPTAVERFAALATAHARLLAYVCGRCTRDGEGEDRTCDLAPAAVEGTPLLTIKRSAPQPVQQGEPSHERDVVAV